MRNFDVEDGKLCPSPHLPFVALVLSTVLIDVEGDNFNPLALC